MIAFRLQHFPKGFNGKADDIGDRFVVAFNDEVTVFLDGIATGFVEGMDFGEVVGDGFFAKRLKGDLVRIDVGFLKAGSKVEECEAGVDGVGFAAEGAEHIPGFVEVGRFVEDGVPEGYRGIGSQYKGIRVAC